MAPNGLYGPKTSRYGQYTSKWLRGFLQPIMAFYGLLWLAMALIATSGSIWLQMAHMAQYGSIWFIITHWGLCNPLWLKMAQNDSYCPKDFSIWLIWLNMALYGFMQPIMVHMALLAKLGSTWLQFAHMAPKLRNMAQCGSLWLLGFLQPSMATDGSMWLKLLELAQYSSQWLS